ncbi:CBS domain-containing protein [Portibacter marinus]|uniref:CBS domain-containing protein n=1 Tax=Portibacter marinus TaxID=2898660 RepID=UPI001F317C22|nr:CBS domain-containing protein [Portibacter marinus]
MGDQNVNKVSGKVQMQNFMKLLLRDVQAMEYMLDNDWFENDITRIGAEQEMVLVNNKTLKAAPIAMEAIEKIGERKWLDTELAKFNLEINVNPQEFKKDCFKLVENEIKICLNEINANLEGMDAQLLLTGILPTLRKFDLNMNNLTPKPRYKALMEAINEQLIGGSYELRINGIDELRLKHDSPLLEACNTSFQVHLQVSAHEFVKMYNICQTLAAPVMAIAANSPLVFGKRLWHESRIAMFQQSIDTRMSHDYHRDYSPRVNFGNKWLDKSITDIYKDDITKFRVLLAGDSTVDSLSMVKNGEVPKLKALQVHNSTVYRWNRPCYGISDNGKPHLRIENRILPSGPTIKDEMANACFWLGLMVGMGRKVDDIRTKIDYANVHDNFEKAVRYGVDSTFTWFGDQKISACDLILEELLPIAREGLEHREVDKDDIDSYLGIIEARAKSHTNGARWLLRSFTKLKEESTNDEALSAITASILEGQKSDTPVHEWDLATLKDLPHYHPADISVSEFMTTDLVTVQKDDIIDLVAQMMQWKKLRYTPVENKKGVVVGLVSNRRLLDYYVNIRDANPGKNMTVEDIMIKNPICVSPETSIKKAMELMRKNKIGCLPVVSKTDLVGVVTEMDFLRVSASLLERIG